MVALFGAAIIAVVVATSASPVARADPPPSHFGPWLEVSPGRGNPSDSFKASYWYVDSDACQYATVTFYWDGKDVGTSTVDSATCTATRTFGDAPTAAEGVYDLTAIACFVDPTGGPQCAPAARTSYGVVPAASLVLKPVSGLASAGLRATYRVNQADCTYQTAQFTWDGSPLGDPVALDGSCAGGPEPGEGPEVERRRQPRPDGHGVRRVVRAAHARTGDLPRQARPPTPTPTPTPDPDTDARQPTPTPYRPRRSRRLRPTVLPSPSDPPTAAPSQAVLGATSPPGADAATGRWPGRHAEHATRWPEHLRAGDRVRTSAVPTGARSTRRSSRPTCC